MARFMIGLTLSSLPLIAGCATFERQAAVKPLMVDEARVEYCSHLRKTYNGAADLEAMIAPVCFGAIAREKPQDYLYTLMTVADRVCARELGALSAHQRTVNAALSTTSTLFSSAATVITGGLADDIVAGLSTLAGSTRDHINSAVYRDGTPELVAQLIQAERFKTANEIISASEADNYSVARATYDANRYHQTCSYYNGLKLLKEAASEKVTNLIDEGEKSKKSDDVEEPESQTADEQQQ